MCLQVLRVEKGSENANPLILLCVKLEEMPFWGHFLPTHRKRKYRRERSYGKFERSFTLPVETDSGKIKAEYKDGVLTLNIPKSESSKTKPITVQ